MVSDAIEQEVFIRAGIHHLWSLVSKAGFWIGQELHFDSVAGEGESTVVDVPTYGRILVSVVRLEPPRYVAYRCALENRDAESTLVEFTLVERPGGVLLRLRESGFATFADAQERHDANVAGWTMQLDRLLRAAEGAPER